MNDIAHSNRLVTNHWNTSTLCTHKPYDNHVRGTNHTFVPCNVEHSKHHQWVMRFLCYQHFTSVIKWPSLHAASLPIHIFYGQVMSQLTVNLWSALFGVAPGHYYSDTKLYCIWGKYTRGYKKEMVHLCSFRAIASLHLIGFALFVLVMRMLFQFVLYLLPLFHWLFHWHGLRWLHNGHNCVSNHQPRHCLLNRLFERTSKKTSKLRVTGLCAGNSPGTSEFPAQMASNAENVSIWWRHHEAQSIETKPRQATTKHDMYALFLECIVSC